MNYQVVVILIGVLCSISVRAQGIGFPSDGAGSYVWTKADSSFLTVKRGDLVAKFSAFDEENDFQIKPELKNDSFYVIFRGAKEVEFLKSYMNTYPNNPPYHDQIAALIRFAVVLGKPNYGQWPRFIGEGSVYQEKLSVILRPDISGIYDMAIEVCDGQFAHYNAAGARGETELSSGIHWGEREQNDLSLWTGISRDIIPTGLSPAPQYCPWEHRLFEVYDHNNNKIWNAKNGAIN